MWFAVAMYFIVVKFQVKPDMAEHWMDLVHDFTQATRAEPGNLFFEWSRSVEDPNEYVLVEASTDEGATPHVTSEHFARAIAEMSRAVATKPRIISRQVAGSGWDEMGEIDPR